MFTKDSIVEDIRHLKGKTWLLKVQAPWLADIIKPGQFCNIKTSEGNYPLLRRPFSICDVEGDSCFFMFDVHGEGTKLMASKKRGEKINILGPLGNGFGIADIFDTAVFVAGGIGSAPFPFLTRMLPDREIVTLFGARNADFVVDYGLKNIKTATDDGSDGFHGTVIELLEKEIKNIKGDIKIFGCGPTPMLKALSEFALKMKLNCEVSTESAMACGFGICQGCPVDHADEDKFLLICKDGPVFNVRDIKL